MPSGLVRLGFILNVASFKPDGIAHAHFANLGRVLTALARSKTRFKCRVAIATPYAEIRVFLNRN